ncbi:FitA-like ribbon-helix-helix domain-containing protein [Pseudonocardia asaccharolytica]|uniref:Antitoxin FitA-like ribbon-helix-helix domain-containing protein n=1 Tax=Pseudonocardia asaccharolytica DSM 44247 = NBRC 16224 TaxID=1123024 RepID=A0A511CZ25_9PSEU|nr:hypothetical protein [Pseudonocardia asaccharolytica]GEL16514.1 hypothetical protein PA7_03510 [Pseudonocardia asaccharolytica DSM 44247 = NBRC 16224]
MSTVITIRDVPDDVKDVLAREARSAGQSLQAFLLGVLKQQAAFGRNRQIIAEIERDLARGGGVGDDAPDAADVLRAERAEGTAAPGRAGGTV